MAQKISEKIEVKYQKYVNGKTEEIKCLLSEIPAEDKASIVSLAILPVLNADGKESKQASDISQYITDFPLLQIITYPKQFSIINVKKIQTTCPNLQKIIRTASAGFEGKSNIAVKGAKIVNIDGNITESDIDSFANIVPSDQDIVAVLEVPVKPTKTQSTTTKKTFITKDDLKLKLDSLDSKLEEIDSKLSGKGDNISKEELEDILSNFVGKITEEQLDSVIRAIESINVNVDISALNNVISDTVNEQLEVVVSNINSAYDSKISEFVSGLADMHKHGETEEELIKYLQENMPELISSNKELAAKTMLAIKGIEPIKSSVSAVEEKVEDVSDNIEAYGDTIIDGIVDLNDRIKEVANNLDLSDNDKQYLEAVMATVRRDITTAVENGDNSLLANVKAEFEGIATSEDVKLGVDRLIKYIGSKVRTLDAMPTKTFIENKLNKCVGRVTEEQLTSIIDIIGETIDDQMTENVEARIESIINERFDAIERANKDKENGKLNQIIANLQEIRTTYSNDAQGMLEAINRFVNGKLPVLIATNRKLTDKLFPTVQSMDRKIDETLDSLGAINNSLQDSKVADELILEELSKIGPKMLDACKSVDLSDESKTELIAIINKFAGDLSENIRSGNRKFINEVKEELGNIITIKDVEEVVSSKLNAFAQTLQIDNRAVSEILANYITNEVLGAINGLENKTKKDLESISEEIDGIFGKEDFQNAMKTILIDSDLARTNDVEKISALITKNHAEELAQLSKINQEMDKMVTDEKLRKSLGEYSQGLSKYMLERLGLSYSADDETLVGMLTKKDRRNEEMFQDLMSEIKKNSMTMADVNAFLASDAGKESISAIITPIIAKAVKAENEQLTKTCKEILANDLTRFVYSCGIAREAIASGGVRLISGGYNAYLGNITLTSQEYNRARAENVVVIEPVQNSIQSLLSILGLKPSPNPSQDSSKDQIIEQLNQQLAERDKKIDDLTKQLEEVKKNLEEQSKTNKEILKKLDALTNQKAEEGNTTSGASKKETGTNGAKNESGKDASKKAKSAEIKASVELPTTSKAQFQKKSIEKMEKLAEPKMSAGKRFKKWLKRHPLALTAIGLGAGALVAAGAGVIAAGGISALIAQAQWFIPTIKTVGIGAGVGLGLGGVGEIIGRVAGLGKRDRLYKKFIKSKEKCEKFKDSMDLLDEEIKNAEQAIENSKQAIKSTKIKFAKSIMKKSTKKQIDNLRKLRAKARVKKSDYKAKVEDFIVAKQQLNAYEEKTGKTTAMIGNLQKLRKAKNQYAQEIDGVTDEDILEDAKDKFDSEIEKIGLDADVKKMSELSDNFKTGDKETEDIINSVKGAKSKTMQAMLDDIDSRNSKEKTDAEQVEYYSVDALKDYVQKVQASDNAKDKENLQKFLDRAKKVNEEALTKLKENGATLFENYFAGTAIERLKEQLKKKEEAKESAAEQADASKTSSDAKESDENVDESTKNEGSTDAKALVPAGDKKVSVPRDGNEHSK